MFSDNTVFFFCFFFFFGGFYPHIDTPHISSEAPTQHTSAWAAGLALVAMLVHLAVAVVQSLQSSATSRGVTSTAALIAPKLSPVHAMKL